MRFREKKSEPKTDDHDPLVFEEYVEAMQPLLQLADALDWPREWLICPSCSAFSWRIPPHVFDACPVIVEMAASAGMKLDAERVQAIKVGLTMDEQMQAFRKFINDHLGGEEDEDDDGD